MSVLDTLTEGIVDRDVQKEGAALLDKWSNTGLLEGIGNDIARNNMARLLENQAAQLLRESSAMASGDVEGFAAVAFPIVRRVFGGLIANDLVSVQPMSLPSGLIFFMDFTYSDDSTSRLSYEQGDSVYGGGVVGQALTGGVDLTGENGEDSFYNLNNGYSSPTGSTNLAGDGYILVASGTVGNEAGTAPHPLTQKDQSTLDSLANFDPDLSGSVVVVLEVTGGAALSQLNTEDLIALQIAPSQGRLVRRVTKLSSGSVGNYAPANAAWKTTIVVETTGTMTLFSQLDGGGTSPIGSGGLMSVTASTGDAASFPINDSFAGTAAAGGLALGAVVGTDTWGLENNVGIPEIDIKVDSVSVTAMTKKLKAKWTPAHCSRDRS